MASLLYGVFTLIGAFALALYYDPFDFHPPIASMAIVCGGTLAILGLSVPMGTLRALRQALFGLLHSEKDFASLRPELDSLLKDKNAKVSSSNLLIRYAVELWEQGVSSDLFVVLLSQKRKEMETKGMGAIQSLKNLAKYPPAFGMVGTVMGMVALFSKLDTNKSNVGISLSLAMISTLLGLLLTNVVIAPLADRLQIKQVHDSRVIEGIYQILLLINSGEPSALIQDEVHLRAAV